MTMSAPLVYGNNQTVEPIPAGSTLVVAGPVGSTMVIAGPGTPTPFNDPAGSLTNPSVQVSGPQTTQVGYGAFKYGNDGKPAIDLTVKTRGSAINTFDLVQSGDRVYSHLGQVGSGLQTAHIFGVTFSVDGSAITAGEANGRWDLALGSGYSTHAPDPQGRAGVMPAVAVNSHAQVAFWGAKAANYIDTGGLFGAQVTFPAGLANAGFAPTKWIITGAALLKTPEAGAFEVDTNGAPYFTMADGVRRRFVIESADAPKVAVNANAGGGAAATISAAGAAGQVVLTIGSGGSAVGDLFTVTYAHPYPVTSYPVVGFGTAASVGQGLYARGDRNGFTVGTATRYAAGAIVTVNYQAPGG